MLRLTNLNKSITTLEGTPIADLMKNKTMTFKTALISICEMSKPVPGTGEGLKAFDIGLRILKANNNLEVTQEDIEFLKKLVNNSDVFLAIVIGQLSHYLEDALTCQKVEKK